MIFFNNVIIRISEEALMQMCLSGLEGYCVKHLHPNQLRKRRRVETYASLWGYHVKHPGKSSEIYCVEMISVDTSSEKRSAECQPDSEALALKRNIVVSFWPQYKFLGDFHTHPYRYPQQRIVKEKLYKFSVDDYQGIVDFSDEWLRLDYKVGIVMTITKLGKKGSKNFEWVNNNTIEFTLDRFRIWIHACATKKCKREGRDILLYRDDDDQNTFLECPPIMGLSNIKDMIDKMGL